ncbi:hypothetical protein KO500_09405 [Cellulophaga baltica]|uniref:hypothetical protein n=1 Tax=Cellulophaga TaxID=104264 RepID=UPI001C06AE31|nr:MULTISPECIES: hypothetical protein [Cellulophaga]MBU2996652.1 hypothetical protein [Cellulophaga baltica]MDO6768046.1 hypothetical protein [Cellulophaga sp. 1_MG-2023]
MKIKLLFILFFFVSNLSKAQELETKYHDIVSIFAESIKTRNIEKLKTLIAYPLTREYPIPDIKNEIEFEKRFDDVFDDKLINEISSSNLYNDWSAVGWRGIMLNNGTLWLDYDGKLIAVNYQSDIEAGLRAKLIETDRNAIHYSLTTFKNPELILETKKFRIRIDELEDQTYRYASWSINSGMDLKPDLVLKNGQWIREGTGGNHSYEFTNGNYKYICSINVIGTSESAPANLIVYKNDERILIQNAQIVKK